MANESLPSYLASAKSNPMSNRAPWYKNTAPTYAGIFLSVPFMSGLAGSLVYGSLWAGIVGLIIGSLFCFVLTYVPGMLGMRTGMPLYVVGSSTFGTKGGFILPGLVMGFLQIGWHAVMTYAAAGFVMQLIGMDKAENATVFWIVCYGWGLALALVGAVGIGLLAKLSSFLPILPLAMIIVASFSNLEGLGHFKASIPEAAAGFGLPLFGLAAFAALQATAGFFATAGAAGADFCMNNRNEKDVALGAFFGVTVAPIVAGIFALMAMAGAMGSSPEIAKLAGTQDCFIKSIAVVTGSFGWLASLIFIVACLCPTGFCAFIFANSFSTMIPKVPRTPMALVAGLIGATLAATGVANNLIIFFLIIGASFGPVIGAMTAEYLRHGKWMGPRRGINWAGYLAWLVGFAVGMIDLLPAIADTFDIPCLKVVGFGYGLATLMSFVAGFAAYLVFANVGLEPKTVELPGLVKEQQ